jgi:hypothetical protein
LILTISTQVVCQCFDFDINSPFLEPALPAVLDEEIRLSFIFCNRMDALDYDENNPLVIEIENRKMIPVDSTDSGVNQIVNSLFNVSYSNHTWRLVQKTVLPASTCLNISTFFIVSGDSFSTNPDIGSSINIIEPSSVNDLENCNDTENDDLEVYTYTIDFSPPVDLVSFNVIQLEREVILEWETTSEVEIKNYIIEKSSDGVEFDEIGILPAVGNSSESIHYQFVDNNLQHGLAYYRFSQTGVSGKSLISPTRTLFIDLGNYVSEYLVSPNPVFDSFQISGTGEQGNLNFKIFNTRGNLIHEGAIEMFNNYQITDLNAGIYIFYLFLDNDFILSEKLIKL